jgi:ABC-type uncharacterized transport system substrate-binding protein
MTPSQIITQDVQSIGGDADVMLRKIDKLVKSKGGFLIQKNNSLMLIISIAKGVAEVHFFIADDSAKLKDSMAKFAKQLKSSELKTIYGTVEKQSNDLLEEAFTLLQKNGINVQKSNLPRYIWMALLKGAK